MKYEDFITPTDCIIYKYLHPWWGNYRLGYGRSFYVCMTKRTENEKSDEYGHIKFNASNYPQRKAHANGSTGEFYI